jgi:hypothetical protein
MFLIATLVVMILATSAKRPRLDEDGHTVNLLELSTEPYGSLYAKSLGCTAEELQDINTGWQDKTADDLFRMYEYVFPNNNRNAASHLWASFLLDRSAEMTTEKLSYYFSSFCPVSGSPVQPDSEEQTWFYENVLADLNGVKASGFMMHCCAPCVCDAADWLTVDTKTISTSSGPQEFNFVVVGNPCEGDSTLIPEDAPDVTCTGTTLDGATLSDGGHPIVGMLHANESRGTNTEEMSAQCKERYDGPYLSGMGQIFIDVANINPIPGTHSASVVVSSAPKHWFGSQPEDFEEASSEGSEVAATLEESSHGDLQSAAQGTHSHAKFADSTSQLKGVAAVAVGAAAAAVVAAVWIATVSFSGRMKPSSNGSDGEGGSAVHTLTPNPDNGIASL